MTKAELIKQLLKQNKSVAEIAKQVDTSRQYVYTVAYKVRKSTEQQEATFWQKVKKFFLGD